MGNYIRARELLKEKKSEGVGDRNRDWQKANEQCASVRAKDGGRKGERERGREGTSAAHFNLKSALKIFSKGRKTLECTYDVQSNSLEKDKRGYREREKMEVLCPNWTTCKFFLKINFTQILLTYLNTITYVVNLLKTDWTTDILVYPLRFSIKDTQPEYSIMVQKVQQQIQIYFRCKHAHAHKQNLTAEAVVHWAVKFISQPDTLCESLLLLLWRHFRWISSQTNIFNC